MKFIKPFNESTKEKIALEDFLHAFKQTKFFVDEEIEDYYSPEEWPNNFISSEVLDNYGFKYYGDEPNFPYELVNLNTEKGDGKDEETVTGIFKRKSDGKEFSLYCHDRGFIGPSTLYVPPFLEEI